MKKRIIVFAALGGLVLAGCKDKDKNGSKPSVSPDKPGTGSLAAPPAGGSAVTEHGATPDHGAAHAGSGSAHAVIGAASGSQVAGTVDFTDRGGKVHVVVHLSGLGDGEHGFHIHEKGDCSAADAASAGGHYNPSNQQHGGPMAAMHHAGDFGNITAKAGVADVELDLEGFTVAVGPTSIDGRAIVVHEKADDLTTQPSGNSGARIGCGVIRGASPSAATPTETEPAAPAAPPTPAPTK